MTAMVTCIRAGWCLGLKASQRAGSSTMKDETFGDDAVSEGEEGGFGIELGVEGKRALRKAVFARAEVLEPGVAVG